ncbi:uncharacterized protein C8A04DRAFT_25871 [Dichotomopilus funicola]|uniref:Aminoglycoside phosphotransferase domain-containing protein n=1 Tax=Dichotomopilus funicola TaxID=1934379 RepID=A0AAN6ZRD2_9PEZI|nr:hypothetical protein C8A04DRAFT_25871 [Dichotomopilus funicola]
MAGILLNGRQRTLNSAADDEDDFLLAIQHQRAAERFREQIRLERDSIVVVVRHHLRLRRGDSCAVLPSDSWIQGGFNLCVLVDVRSRASSESRRVVFRCPMPHKLAEQHHPGTIDEKVSCEAAVYAWMQAHCTDIRIPYLYAFGFAGGSQFAHISQWPWYFRLWHSLKRLTYLLLGYALLSNYTRVPCTPAVNTAYMLLEYIGPETGQMLSATWAQHRHDSNRRARLFHGIARTMLSLARLPQPHIGSFKFNQSDGTITLTNRPLISTMMIFENSRTPRNIQPRQLYQSPVAFAYDMLTLHDNYFLHYAHAIRDDEEARERITIRTLLRTVMHHFMIPERQNGPFLLQPTDLHQSNIFVDEEWNVTCLIDLEWICSLPAEMLAVPYWLTSCSIDNIINDEYKQFDEARQAFLAAMEEEMITIPPAHDIPITRTMLNTWVSKAVWFWACIRSLNGWLFLFEDHIAPKFCDNRDVISDLKQTSAFWREDIDTIVKAKVEDEERYQAKLRSLFSS